MNQNTTKNNIKTSLITYELNLPNMPITLQEMKAAIATAIAENNPAVRKMVEEVVKEHAAKEKRREAKAKRDPNKPKRPKNAYQLWCDEVRAEVKETCGDNLRDVSKELGARWKQMKDEEKQPYKQMYEELKAGFKEEMEEYEKNKKNEE